MQTNSSIKPVKISQAERPLDEVKIHMANAKTIIGQIIDNERETKRILEETKSDDNNKLFVKKRRLIVFVAAFVEALLSVRAFAYILHSLLNIPYGPNSIYLDFVIGVFFSYLIIEGSIWILNFERKFQKSEKDKIGASYLILGIVPILNLGIYAQTEDKSGEWIYLALSFFTLAINIFVVRLVSKSFIDERFDQKSKGQGERLDKLKDGKESLYKRFDLSRHRVEFMAPAFLKAYKQLSETDQRLITFGVDYLYVLQERVFAGQNVELGDASKINPADYPFISQWDKVNNRQPLT